MQVSMSLTTRTLLTTAASLVIFVAGTAAIVYSTAREEALARNDVHLSDVATALARAEVGVVLPRALTMDGESFQERIESEKPLPGIFRGPHHRQPVVKPNPGNPPRQRRTQIPAGEKVLIRLLDKQGQAVRTRLEEPLPAGLATGVVAGEAYRIYTIFLPTGRSPLSLNPSPFVRLRRRKPL